MTSSINTKKNEEYNNDKQEQNIRSLNIKKMFDVIFN